MSKPGHTGVLRPSHRALTSERTGREKRPRVAFFGHFGTDNFGNESTFQAILYHLRRFHPDAEVTCICTRPDVIVATHHIAAISSAETLVQFWLPRHPLMKVARRVLIGIPGEPYRWVKIFLRLRRTDTLIIPGTGLLTDVHGLLSWGWGPYNVFKWSLLAKISRCQLLFVSVGAGPIYSVRGRCLVRWALSLADFRSYRDDSTKQYLESIGVRTDQDPIYPDLVFSLPESLIPQENAKTSRRPVAGLGLMVYPGKLSGPRPNDEIYRAYLENLASVAGWLLARGYDVRLLIGDLEDMRATQELSDLIKERSGAHAGGHIIDEPVSSVEGLVSQIAATDIVVATRFHNVLLALLCDKPVIAISFHHKCESLMSAMGLSEYCLDFNALNGDRVIEKFCDLEIDADRLKPLMRAKAREFREALDEQYRYIFNDMCSA